MSETEGSLIDCRRGPRLLASFERKLPTDYVEALNERSSKNLYLQNYIVVIESLTCKPPFARFA